MFSAALCRGLIEATAARGLSSRRGTSFPRLYAAASLKHMGLTRDATLARVCFPRLYAAASLKLWRSRPWVLTGNVFSAALCRGLIEANTARHRCSARRGRFSAALCRGLIEAARPRRGPAPRAGCFPRLYAAASLKRRSAPDLAQPAHGFPRLYAAASLKRTGWTRLIFAFGCSFPRLYAAASLKRD